MVRGHIFADPAVLKAMLDEYVGGATCAALAEKYGCSDHTSISRQVRKHGVVRSNKRTHEAPTEAEASNDQFTTTVEADPPIIPQKKVTDPAAVEKRAQGKNYREYMKKYNREVRELRREARERARVTIAEAKKTKRAVRLQPRNSSI